MSELRVKESVTVIKNKNISYLLWMLSSSHTHTPDNLGEKKRLHTHTQHKDDQTCSRIFDPHENSFIIKVNWKFIGRRKLIWKIYFSLSSEWTMG